MKKKNIFLIITSFIIGLILCNPIICKAWTVENTSVSNIVIREERLTSFDFHFEIPYYLAETQSWLGIQTFMFDDEDLTDLGNVYEKNYTSIDKLKADDDFLFDYGIKQFSKKSFPCFGNYNTIDQTLSDLSINKDDNNVYYIYLWTYYNGGFYPDILLATVTFNNGTIKITDKDSTEIVSDTFENLEADVVEKIEINNVNYDLKVGKAPTFTGEIKNSDKFDFIETFMSLNRLSTIESNDDTNNNDNNELIKDFKYFHISEVYIKDNVNLKFDENTKVFINGEEINKKNIFLSSERISVSNEDDAIIPEDYVAPAYLEQTFEEEQKIALAQAIMKYINAKQVTFNSDEVKNIVNDALDNGGTVELDVCIYESIPKSLREYYLYDDALTAFDNEIDDDYIIGAYYDISIEVYVNGFLVGYVTAIPTPLSVVIPYPNGIKSLSNGYQREWKFLRYHEGNIDELDIEKIDDGLKIENDKYSAFALIYKDTKIDETNTDGTDDETTTDGTDDETNTDGTDDETNTDGTDDQTNTDGTDDQTNTDGTDDETNTDGTDDQTNTDGTDDETNTDGTDDETTTDGTDDETNTDGTDDETNTDGTDEIDEPTNTNETEVENTQTNKTNNPQTGDNIMNWIYMLVISVISLCILGKIWKNSKI